ncbi:hypothetical protein PTUN_a2947 [Pseudoalteromonas tunicata]|nr:hypothetical protein PTUN_a2947 [Pseudoalteromonas tunicata]
MYNFRFVIVSALVSGNALQGEILHLNYSPAQTLKYCSLSV